MRIGDLKSLPEEPERFKNGAYEVPIFFHEEGNKKVIGIAWVDIEDGDMSASLEIDHKAFMAMGFDLMFEETNFPHEGSKYSLHARKKPVGEESSTDVKDEPDPTLAAFRERLRPALTILRGLSGGKWEI